MLERFRCKDSGGGGGREANLPPDALRRSCRAWLGGSLGGTGPIHPPLVQRPEIPPEPNILPGTNLQAGRGTGDQAYLRSVGGSSAAEAEVEAEDSALPSMKSVSPVSGRVRGDARVVAERGR